jgi:hypothetical protein
MTLQDNGGGYPTVKKESPLPGSYGQPLPDCHGIWILCPDLMASLCLIAIGAGYSVNNEHHWGDFPGKKGGL